MSHTHTVQNATETSFEENYMLEKGLGMGYTSGTSHIYLLDSLEK